MKQILRCAKLRNFLPRFAQRMCGIMSAMAMKYMNANVRRTITAVGGVLCCTLFTMSTFAELCDDGVGVMSIAGRWRFALGDSTNCTDVIDLPSTTDIARKGNGRINARELEKIDPMRDDAYLTEALTRHPTRRFPYVVPATYERDVDVPAEWAGKRIELLIERTKYVSVYFDGKPIGRCETLATPAVVELPRGTLPGRHRLRLVVDNSLRGRPLSGAYQDPDEGRGDQASRSTSTGLPPSISTAPLQPRK